jgi:hypothetical protein
MTDGQQIRSAAGSEISCPNRLRSCGIAIAFRDLQIAFHLKSRGARLKSCGVRVKLRG